MNKYVMISSFFVIIIGIVSVKTFVENRKLFVDAISSSNKIEAINHIYDDNIAYKEDFLAVWSKAQEKIGAELIDDAEYGHLMKDDTGNLYFPARDVSVEKFAEQLVSLSEKVKEKNIPFYYIQAPNKIVPGYSSDMIYQYNFSNKNADEFLEIIEKSDVTTLDLRKMIDESGIPKNQMFYKTDHHWTTPTAFWACKTIVHYLNENNPFNIENFGTSYEIKNGVTGQLISSGNFHQAIVKDHILNSNDFAANKHATYFEWDYGDIIIKNKKIDNDIKILLIKDSYALPVGAFLSTCVSELEMVDLRDTPKANLKKIIDDGKFDVVMVMYNTEVFDERMFDFGI